MNVADGTQAVKAGRCGWEVRRGVGYRLRAKDQRRVVLRVMDELRRRNIELISLLSRGSCECEQTDVPLLQESRRDIE